MSVLTKTESKILLLIIVISLLSIIPYLYSLFSTEFQKAFLILPQGSKTPGLFKKIITAEDLNKTWLIPQDLSNQVEKSLLFDPILFNLSNSSTLITARLEKDRKVTNPSIKCAPKSTGYSDSQVSSIFPNRFFANCKEATKEEVVRLVENNSITFRCPTNPGMYFLSVPAEKERLGRVEYKVNWENFYGKKKVDMLDREFVMIKCSFSLKGAYVKNQFNQQAADRAKAITSSLIRALNLTSFNPLNVHMIILDSMSRSHFYRNLKSTIDYLNNDLVNSKDYVVYDFLNNNAHGENTRPNLVSLLLGKDFEDHLADIKGLKIDDEANELKFQQIQNSSLWKHYERLGFVTLFEYDTVWNFFCDDIGRKVYTDAKLLNFWNAAKNVFSYTDFIQKPRCFGRKNGHWFLFEYLRSFVRNYQGINKFTYMHTSIAHENSGTIIRTLDDDLKEAVQDLVRMYEENNEDFLIVLAGDHGRRVQEWDRTIEGIYENKHPFHLIITKQSLIRRMGKETHEILTHNTERLVSRFDWHLSLLHLATFPYGNLDPLSDFYKLLKTNLPVSTAVSVFLEKIPDSRTCSDMKIQRLYCLCRDFEEIDTDSSFVVNVLEKMVFSVIEKINSNLQNNQECKKINFSKVLKAEEFIMKKPEDGGNTLFRIHFGVKENKNAMILVYFYAAPASEYKRMKINLDGKIHRNINEEYLNGYQIHVEWYKRIDVNNCPLQNGSESVCIC